MARALPRGARLAFKTPGRAALRPALPSPPPGVGFRASGPGAGKRAPGTTDTDRTACDASSVFSVSGWFLCFVVHGRRPCFLSQQERIPIRGRIRNVGKSGRSFHGSVAAPQLERTHTVPELRSAPRRSLPASRLVSTGLALLGKSARASFLHAFPQAACTCQW